MKELNVEIITPSKLAYSGKVKSISLPGTLGNFQVLFNHAPLLSTIEVGRIKIVDLNDIETEYTTSGGSVEVLNNKILVLADSFESKEEIDIERAENALQRAKERLANRNKEKIDELRVEIALRRAINRIKFARSSD
ncbi:MAG: ATP synthase F1 subunit epsilon [Melioribacteraceae bacterium]|jgi:F-type H+-transporting ATPase subunit epsilon|nr:ATP synthase F1 subunit epsilon [Melioribacteraceae bacterium]